MEKNYKVFADFYKIKIDDKNIFQCRSVVEIIVDNLSDKFIYESNKSEVDAIFILKNPGECRPINPDFEEEIIDIKSILRLKKHLVEASTDQTLKQLIEIMNYKNWNIIRVINLSDIRSSSVFETELQKISKYSINSAHSIFSPARESELNVKLIIRKNMPLICAWSYEPNAELVKLFLDSQAGKMKRIGIFDGKYGYKHPNLHGKIKNKKWVKELLELIKEF